MSNTGHKNISRYKGGKKKGTGLQVSVQWRGEIRRQSFPDRDFDSLEAVLFAAIDWRDETEAELGKPRTDRRILSDPGIYRSVDFYGAASWVAQWSPAFGIARKKYYSIKKYGELEAQFLALAKRIEMEKKYYGGSFREREL